MFTKVKKYPHEIKGIELGHYQHYYCSMKALGDFKKSKDELLQRANALSKGKADRRLNYDLTAYYHNAVLNSACYIEAALNFLLTYRLGAKLFEETVERNSPEQKLFLVHVLWKNEIPIEKGNNFRLFKKLFKMRNDIVHYKSAETESFGTIVGSKELIKELERDLSDVERAVAAFKEYVRCIIPFAAPF